MHVHVHVWMCMCGWAKDGWKTKLHEFKNIYLPFTTLQTQFSHSGWDERYFCYNSSSQEQGTEKMYLEWECFNNLAFIQ